MENEAPFTVLNLDKVCRVCLQEHENMASVQSQMVQGNVAQKLSKAVSEIITALSDMNVKENDGLPQSICHECLQQAYSSFEFREKCNQSHAVLCQYAEKSKLHTLDVNGGGKLVLNIYSSLESGKEVEDEGEENLVNSPFNEAENEDNFSSGDSLKNKDDYDCTDFAGEIHSCNICNRVYKYKRSLTSHMKKHTEDSQYICKVCGKSFQQYTDLFYHKRKHIEVQPHVCKICGKRYRQSGTLTAHMRVHTGNRPYLCSICGKRFRQAPDLNYHMRTHTKEKRYMCNVCGKTMSMQCHLVQHMKTHTGERPYKCGKCSKAFPSSTRLKRHAIIHTDLKPFMCEVCSKSFNRQSSLKVHAKIHTDERAFACPLCDKRFIQAHNLRSHILTHSTSNTS